MEQLHRHEVENGTHQLETLLCASIDKNFDLFELYAVRNILCVRPEDRDWMRLGHYEGLDFAAPTEDTPTVESVTGLRRRLQASQRLNAMLRAEEARNDALLESLRAVLGTKPPPGARRDDSDKAGGQASLEAGPPPPLAFLRDQGDLTSADGQTPISTTTAFTLSQLQALRALSTTLRSLAPDLAA